MADLISRSALFEDIKASVIVSGRSDGTVVAELKGIQKVLERIMEAPAVDAVPVVRCKDCKWLYDEMDDYCCRSHRGLVRICENSYCSYGERKENETD